jgi:hypothetical protein
MPSPPANPSPPFPVPSNPECKPLVERNASPVSPVQIAQAMPIELALPVHLGTCALC